MGYLLLGYAVAIVLIGGYCLHAWLDLRRSAEGLSEAGKQVRE